MSQPDAKPDLEMLQVRITRAERETFEAASPNGKAATEIMRRAREYQAGAAGTPERAIGDLAALVAGRAIAALRMLSSEDIEEGWDPHEEFMRDSNRYRLLAMVRDALAKAFNEIGAQFADPPEPDVLTAITYDLAKRLHTQTKRDPEGRLLARIGQALGLEIGMPAENLARQQAGAPLLKPAARKKDPMAITDTEKE